MADEIRVGNEALRNFASGTLGRPPTSVRKLLGIADEIELIVENRGWSWCDLDIVYRILKAAHEGR